MQKIYFIVVFVFLGLLISTSSCAKRGTITGGLKDSIPPKIISSSPQNFETNFSGKEIKIVFDELIKVKDISKQLIISPPLKKQPIIVPQGSASKFISIKILDTLQKNTTYSFNFGQSIIDNNENNPYSQFKYVFSTGDYIDSLTIVGKIKDAYEKKAESFVSVLLYDALTFNDSTVYKQTPLYITNTLDSLKLFSLENLKEGKYHIIALKDKNNNNKFDPKQDKIGFLNYPITIPTDTIYELELFAEKPEFKVEKPTQETQYKFFMGFKGNPKEAKINIKKGDGNIPFKIMKYNEKNNDSIQLFIPKIEADSLEFSVENEKYLKKFTSKFKKIKEVDSLKIDFIQTNSIRFRDTLSLKGSTPISSVDLTKINLFDKDSIPVKYSISIDEFENKVYFHFEKEENQKYKIEILPGGIVDFYNQINDTLENIISTKSFADYGNLRVNLKNVSRFPLLVEILDEKGAVMASQHTNKELNLRFDLIDPRIYTLRAIYDDNGNKRWDTGDYLSKKQAEQVIYFSKEIDVRANWDVEQDFDLK